MQSSIESSSRPVYVVIEMIPGEILSVMRVYARRDDAQHFIDRLYEIEYNKRKGYYENLDQYKRLSPFKYEIEPIHLYESDKKISNG